MSLFNEERHAEGAQAWAKVINIAPCLQSVVESLRLHRSSRPLFWSRGCTLTFPRLHHQASPEKTSHFTEKTLRFTENTSRFIEKIWAS